MSNSLRDRTRSTVFTILKHDLYSCDEGDDIILNLPGNLNDLWLMPRNRSPADLVFRLWFVKKFSSPERFEQAVAVCDEIDAIAQELVTLHAEMTGDSTYLPPALLSSIKCRLLSVQWPELTNIINEANASPSWNAKMAKAHIEQYCYPGDGWLARS